MFVETSEIVQKSNRIHKQRGSRDPYVIADELGIQIMECPFSSQRGAYKVIKRNHFIFVKEDLAPVMKNIVLLHEIGHDILHRNEAAKTDGFQEFEIFDMRESRMEYEANVFASQIALDDDKFLEYYEYGYDSQQIACAMHSHINLIALKVNILISQGYRLRPQEHKMFFLDMINNLKFGKDF